MEGLTEIMHAMPDGREGRIAQIIRTMGTRLRRFVRNRVATDFDAEDVVQDVWQRLITAFEGETVEEAAAWLYTVARNRIIDRGRKRKPESLEGLAAARSGGEAEEFDAWLPGDGRTPVTEHLRHQFWEELSAALAELPPEQRQVFVWHEFEAMSFRDIADLTGENLNTLLSRKRYAVLHLRRRLQTLRDEMISDL